MRDLEVHLAEHRRTLSDVQPEAFDDLFDRAQEEVMGFDWKSPSAYLNTAGGLLSTFGGSKKPDDDLHARISQHLDDEKRKADAQKGLSKNAKIAIGVGVGVAALGLLAALLRKKR